MTANELKNIFEIRELPFENYYIPDDDRHVFCFPAKSYRKCRVDMWKEKYLEYEDANLLKAYYNFGEDNRDIVDLIETIMDGMDEIKWRLTK